jgi:hypothetical protein
LAGAAGDRRAGERHQLGHRPVVVRTHVNLMLLVHLAVTDGAPFIYFQF